MKIGEILQLFVQLFDGGHVVQTFPLFLSFKVFQCKIKHYFSYVKINSDRVLEEAHFHVEPPATPFLFSKECITLTIKSLALHLYPEYSIFEQGKQIDGQG